MRSADCLCLGDGGAAALRTIAARYGVRLNVLDDDAPITGSFWGEPEAGVLGRELFARRDTPLHSALHELAHVVCMTPGRRLALDTDAGGDDLEEAAVCYLQILFADYLPGFGRHRSMRDMDAWGYSFRLGSTAAWFAGDASDALAFLERYELVDGEGRPTWRLRDGGRQPQFW